MAAQEHRFDPNFTKHVIETIGPACGERERFVMSALIRHVHDFAREVELTVDEWTLGTKFLNSIGQISDAKRNEGHRISDVLGLESLVDEIAHKHVNESGESPTSSSILGPFWSPNAPFRENGDSVIMSPHSGHVTLMHGVVSDMETKAPIKNAVFDFWQASSNGKYDFQDPDNQVDNNLRGKFRTNDKGEYHFYCLKPTAYSLPTDGPAGMLLKLLDRHPMRPAHIHLMISADDYKPVTTQIFPKDDPYLETDTVFAVKDDLVVDFTPLKGDDKAELECVYNVSLAPKGSDKIPDATRLPSKA
ncbi:putative catechol 1,2-dioxygenase [Aulographum hederae CBS 113979]|uniref:Putative catechol 1,2-dioxygenase n=1 Tax=Aulographum hederae CBS 113979 TaxID=1176131 RepID=A0A6G1GT55_9PEZI|nr:putative catechol 1,2-dioxygenase [Aulographum hederae CBS 113979]